MTDRTAPVIALLLPGATFMEIRQISFDTVLICCPGCGATKVYTSRPPDPSAQSVFLHETDDCPVLVRIEAAVARLDAAQTAVKH